MKMVMQFVKFGLTSEALRSYVELITKEVNEYVANSNAFKQLHGTIDVGKTMAEITIYTASRSLQGKEVRDKFDSTFAELYHDLDMGFAPINFMLPWAPLPHNRKRDAAQKKMAETYMEIIRHRRQAGGEKDSEDMVWNLMSCVYKDGTPVPDMEVAHMMIALLMAGQHSSSSTISWIILRLASQPKITEQLYQEQIRVLGPDLPPLTHENLQKLELQANVIKETLRLHAPIHSILRAVKSPLQVEGTPYVIPTSHNVLSSPGVTARSPEHFSEPLEWDPHRWDGVKAAEDDEQVDYGYGLISKGAGSPYLPFGAGRHRCIGEQFAYVQLGAICAALVRQLKFKNLPNVEGVPATDYSVSFLPIISISDCVLTCILIVIVLQTLGELCRSIREKGCDYQGLICPGFHWRLVFSGVRYCMFSIMSLFSIHRTNINVSKSVHCLCLELRPGHTHVHRYSILVYCSITRLLETYHEYCISCGI